MRMISTSLLLAIPLLWAPVHSHATSLGNNLIVNGNAEADAPSATGFEVVPVITGWTRTDNLTLVGWATGGGFPLNSDPGPAVRGNAFFAGGPSSASSEIFQTIDIADLAGSIDAGNVAFRLAGYLGGFADQEDNATLQIIFRDALAAAVSGTALGPVSAADRASSTGLLLRTQEGPLPVGTRSVELRLVCTRLTGSYNHGYADSLAFVLRSSTVGVAEADVPELAFSNVAPSPMRDFARFAFQLPQRANVRLDVIDVLGRRVAVIMEGELPVGAHAPTWRRSANTRPGVYFARLQVGSHVMQRRFVVLD